MFESKPINKRFSDSRQLRVRFTRIAKVTGNKML